MQGGRGGTRAVCASRSSTASCLVRSGGLAGRRTWVGRRRTQEVPFRPTEEEALSYFVTGIIPEDTGFAIAPYTAVSFDNHGCIFDSDSATCMGEYYFTGTDSSVTKVEYTFGYKKDAEGNLKIVVHHSSLPYGS